MLQRFVAPFILATLCALQPGCLGGRLNGAGSQADAQGGADGATGSDASGGSGSTAGTNDRPVDDPAVANAPFSPLPLSAQVRKVKMLLTGAPVTDDDLKLAATDLGLQKLIANWQNPASAEYASYRNKMTLFLGTALQQTQADADHLTLYNQGIDFTASGVSTFRSLRLNITESMGRTAFALDSMGQPFSAVMTTHAFMMTTALKKYYAVLDAVQQPEGVTRNQVRSTDPAIGSNMILGTQILSAIIGSLDPNVDFDDWQMVNVRQPANAEATTKFQDPGIRAAKELVLLTPRQGFMTTPAFFGQWRSNEGNSDRVLINQTLAVALGRVFDGANNEMPLSTATADAEHVKPGTACYGCHLSMDPMRQMFRRYYSYTGSMQADAAQMNLPAQFVFAGVRSLSTSADDLGSTLASHPMMPMAWAQKVCDYANSSPCEATDPELMRIASNFAAGGSYQNSFSKLVQGIFSSPLVTYAKATQTTVNRGVVFSLSKADQLCAAIAMRLGLDDPCYFNPAVIPWKRDSNVQTVASAFPIYSFARGVAATPQANDPSLFYRSGLESLCYKFTQQVAYTDEPAKWNVYFGPQALADPNGTIAKLVATVMGVPDSEAAPLREILANHRTAYLAQNNNPTAAMQSTFVAACMSPAVAGIGQ